MKLTREEFKEFMSIYEQAWNNFDKYADIINSDLLDSLMFPIFNWMERKLGTYNDNIGCILMDYICEAQLHEPIDNLDKLYNDLFGESE